jgi:hypothetical protein
MEIWEQFRDTKYFISNLGEIKDNKGKILKQFTTVKGYLRIKLVIDNKRVNFSVHRLVGEVFIGNIIGFQIDHINRVKTDNRVVNLRIVTSKENNQNKTKISISNISKIVELSQNGVSVDEIEKIINN